MTATESRHASRGVKSLPLAYRRIFSFWLPLAGTWLMMAAEGPYLAAIIARLPDAAPNLAAFGVAFAFAIIIESPVIMLMSASTALVEDAASFRALRRFAIALLGPRREHFAQSLAGRVVGVSWLVAPCVRVLRTGPATETSAQDESDTASTEAIG